MSEQNTALTPADNGNGKAPLQVGGRVSAIVPQSIEQVYRVSNAIARADMAPKSYDRNPEKIMVAIMHGMEVGLTPMAALQSIAVINSMPTIWGDGAMGLVEGSGLLEDKQEWIEGEGDNRKAVCKLKRKGRSSPIIGEFSVADAKEAVLWAKAGPWKQYPRRMLQMRARAWALRDGFADVLKGLAIREEVQDMGDLVPGDDGSYRPVPPPRPLRSSYEDEDPDSPERRASRARIREESLREYEEKQRAEREAREAAAMDAEYRAATTGYVGDDPEPEPDDGEDADEPPIYAGDPEGVSDPEDGEAGYAATEPEPGQPDVPATPEDDKRERQLMGWLKGQIADCKSLKSLQSLRGDPRVQHALTRNSRWFASEAERLFAEREQKLSRR